MFTHVFLGSNDIERSEALFDFARKVSGHEEARRSRGHCWELPFGLRGQDKEDENDST